jgi:hypothetical protein
MSGERGTALHWAPVACRRRRARGRAGFIWVAGCHPSCVPSRLRVSWEASADWRLRYHRALAQVFSPAFRRQSRWSLVKPVPDLGNEESPYAEVAAFYEFWYTFKSWREFPHPDEEDVEQAESREHRCAAPTTYHHLLPLAGGIPRLPCGRPTLF